MATELPEIPEGHKRVWFHIIDGGGTGKSGPIVDIVDPNHPDDEPIHLIAAHGDGIEAILEGTDPPVVFTFNLRLKN